MAEEFEALFNRPCEGGAIKCELCIIGCRIPDGSRGFCRVRENRGGKLFNMVYGKLSSYSTDFVEKVPLYHFYPNHKFLTVGSAGCNLRCRFCLTWNITQVEPEEVELDEMPPDKLVESASALGMKGIVYTHSEPTLNIEYYQEVMEAVQEAGLKNVWATNGFITLEAFDSIAGSLDAVALTIKGDEDFYAKVCGVRYQRDHVLEFCREIKGRGIHLETVHILVPGKAMEENMKEAIAVARETGSPIIFLRFFPSHKMDRLSATREDVLEEALAAAYEAGVKYAYVENIHSHPGKTTYCENCRAPLIKRMGYGIVDWRLEGNLCPYCETRIPIVGEPAYKRKDEYIQE
jgi:pyruvate formate lyase activating enzyme